jgi:hypothetical protein
MLKAVNMFMGVSHMPYFLSLYEVRIASVQCTCYLCTEFGRQFNLNLTESKFSDRGSGLSFQNLH